jgi:zinc resistance-associated protein
MDKNQAKKFFGADIPCRGCLYNKKANSGLFNSTGGIPMTRGLRKNKLLIVLTTVLSLAMATAAWAGPKGMCGGCDMGDMGMGPGMMGPGMGHGQGHGMRWMNMTPEQVGKAFDMRQKFMDDTAGLRKQILVKHAELRELWKAKEPDKAQIAAKQKEINSLRDQLQEKATAFNLEMRKEFPNLGAGGGCPMMPGGKGMGGGPKPPEGGK